MIKKNYRFKAGRKLYQGKLVISKWLCTFSVWQEPHTECIPNITHSYILANEKNSSIFNNALMFGKVFTRHRAVRVRFRQTKSIPKPH